MDLAIVAKIKDVWPVLTALGVMHLDIFGSFARGQQGPDSDLDVLVETLGAPTLGQLLDVQDCLTKAVGRRVDVLTPGAIARRPRLRAHVAAEAYRVA